MSSFFVCVYIGVNITFKVSARKCFRKWFTLISAFVKNTDWYDIPQFLVKTEDYFCIKHTIDTDDAHLQTFMIFDLDVFNV